MSAVEALIGKQVVDNKGNKVDVSSFCGSGKFVCLYFSAHWCPPCRGFTPVLGEFYTKVKSDASKAGKLEIVFISSDRDAASWDEYFGEMPWKAIDFADRDLKGKLSEKYGVRGIPTLVILNAETGEVFDANGRGRIQGDVEAANFPWA